LRVEKKATVIRI